MISYQPFWELLKRKNISTYWLIQNKNISSSTINRLRKNQPITTTTINDLCTSLDCDISDILLYRKEKKEAKDFEVK